MTCRPISAKFPVELRLPTGIRASTRVIGRASRKIWYSGVIQLMPNESPRAAGRARMSMSLVCKWTSENRLDSRVARPGARSQSPPRRDDAAWRNMLKAEIRKRAPIRHAGSQEEDIEGQEPEPPGVELD